MRHLKLALDCDGFLSDFTSGALRIVEEVTGKSFKPTDVTAFDFTKALGLSVSETAAVRGAISARRGFAAGLTPYPHARQGVRRLRELGDVFCVTRPWDANPWWRDERNSWLAMHFGIDVVHHASDKTAYEADIFVDDESAHIRAWSAAWPDRVAVFWRTPHNLTEVVPTNAHSISSWDSLYTIARDVACGTASGHVESRA